MHEPGESGAVFLTAPPEEAVLILADVVRRFPGLRWTVYSRVSDGADLGDALDGFEVQSDKPAGSKLAFLRELRARRFDVAVVAWTGDPRYQRMKAVALLAGARRYFVYNEYIKGFFLEGSRLVWNPHMRPRPSYLRVMKTLLAVARMLYKWTIGLVMGGVWLSARMIWHRAARDSVPAGGDS